MDALATVGDNGQGLSTQYGKALKLEIRSNQGTQALDAINTIIQLGAVDKNLDGINGYPLIVAACELRTDLAKILLDSGANPNIKTNHGLTPLNFCCYSPTRFISFDDQQRDKKRQIPMIKFLLANPQVDVNIPDDSGRTPLMNAVLTLDWREAITLLMNDPRTDLFYQNSNGETAENLAAMVAKKFDGHDWVVEAFRKALGFAKAPTPKPVSEPVTKLPVLLPPPLAPSKSSTVGSSNRLANPKVGSYRNPQSPTNPKAPTPPTATVSPKFGSYPKTTIASSRQFAAPSQSSIPPPPPMPPK